MSAYSSKVIADGAVAYWRLNETSGTTAVDVIGGNNGTISGGVTLNQAGALTDGDKAMTFNGTGRIDVAKAAYSAIGTGPLTLEAWVWLDPAGGAFMYLGDCKNAGSVESGFLVYFTKSGANYSLTLFLGNGTATTFLTGP